MNEIYEEYHGKFRISIQDLNAVINFELIKKLKSKGLVLGIVSTSKRTFIEELITTLKLEDIFDVIIGREDVEALKPSPDAYHRALIETNMINDVTSTIAIEDSPRGIAASINAGIKTIGVGGVQMQDIGTIDSVTRLLLILNNYL